MSSNHAQAQSPRLGAPAGYGTTPRVVPTNTVKNSLDGTIVRARIDPGLSVDDVIRQLCQNMKIQEPPFLFALRDEADELVTDENLKKKIKSKANLKCVCSFLRICCQSLSSPLLRSSSYDRLVSAPAIEANEIIGKMAQKDDATAMRMAVHNLGRFIKEEQFAIEFLKRGGLGYLIDIIGFSHGNTLAVRLCRRSCFLFPTVFDKVRFDCYAESNGAQLRLVNTRSSFH